MDARYFRFAAFYFCYYAALGAYTPYVGRWVDALGHSGYVVGAMLGLWYGSRIVAPPLWTPQTSRSARPGRWLLAGTAATALSFGLFTLTQNATALLLVMLVFGLFFNAIMPQFEAMTLTELGERRGDYGRIRVWGSIGFLLVAASYGSLLDRLGNHLFPWLSLPLFLALLAVAWLHRGNRPLLAEARVAGTKPAWKRPGVPRFLAVVLLMQLGFGPFYVFYTLHLQRQGHDGLAIGLLWGLGVLIEIALFWQAPRLLERFGAARLLSYCFALTVLRWLLTAAFAASLPIMALAQCTHAFSFAIFHACCMQRIGELFPARELAAGQSLYYGFSSGVGGVLGAGMAALLWEWRGGAAAFVAAALVTALAWWLHGQPAFGRHALAATRD
jgi:PPP family 3-phenylpropionic acid transporter